MKYLALILMNIPALFLFWVAYKMIILNKPHYGWVIVAGLCVTHIIEKINEKE